MTSKQKNVLIAVLFLVFGVALYWQSTGIRQRMKNDMGSGFFPKVVAVCIVTMAGVRLATALKEPSKAAEKSDSDPVGGILTIVFTCLYAAAFNDVGFIISTGVFLLLEMLVLTPKEKRNIPLIVGLSVITPLFVYALFVYAINSPLPKGLYGF